jgi:hypothetical protein
MNPEIVISALLIVLSLQKLFAVLMLVFFTEAEEQLWLPARIVLPLRPTPPITASRQNHNGRQTRFL